MLINYLLVTLDITLPVKTKFKFKVAVESPISNYFTGLFFSAQHFVSWRIGPIVFNKLNH